MAYEHRLERLRPLVDAHSAEFRQRAQDRSPIEQRWLEDLRQYHGKEDEKTERETEQRKRSRITVNLTRPKTDTMSAKLGDLLFPRDDKNWGIDPTPIPELTKAAAQAKEEADRAEQEREELERQALEAGDPDLAGQAANAQALAMGLRNKAEAAAGVMEEARRRCKAMEAEMADQLTACDYANENRDAIHQGCILGPSVLKGPVTDDRTPRRWRRNETGGYELQAIAAAKPAFRHVNVLNYFPQIVRRVEDSEGHYERHLYSKQKIRRLQHAGFDKEALRALLKEDPADGTPQLLTDIAALSGEKTAKSAKQYHVIEYNGPVSDEDMLKLVEIFDGPEAAAQMEEQFDPLETVQATIWFCQGHLLKFGIYPLDSGEELYSVFNIVEDETCLFGYGIPYILRNPQKMLNAATRIMMDNAGITTGPQVLINTEAVEPEDGEWNLRPFKIWKVKAGIPKDERIFDQFSFNSHQPEAAAIMQIAQKFMDDEAGIPQLAQGEQGSGVTKTFQGMALLMNATNVIFRRVVRNYDKNVTLPNIRRLYHWNMQFNPKEELKGDYEVDARGSSVLLVREIQAQNALSAVLQFSGHPVLGRLIKDKDLLREALSLMLFTPDKFLKTDDELAREEEEERKRLEEQGQQGNPEFALKGKELELREAQLMSDAQKAMNDNALQMEELASRERVAAMQLQGQMITLSEKTGMELEKISAQSETALAKMLAELQDKREQRVHEKEQLAGEMHSTLITGQSAGGLA